MSPVVRITFPEWVTNVLSSDSASEKLGNTIMTDRPIVTASKTIIKAERVVFNMLTKLEILYLKLT